MLQVDAYNRTESDSDVGGPGIGRQALGLLRAPELEEALPAELRNVLLLADGHTQYMRERIDLIASNTYVSRWVSLVMSSALTNNYSIGVPGNRLYGGCAYIDLIEREVGRLARQVFGMEHVVSQFLSGMQANTAAYHALLRQGDTVVSASVRHGGHYSHNSQGPLRWFGARVLPVPFAPDVYNLDLDQLEVLLAREQPRLLILGWSEFLFPHPLADVRSLCDRHGVQLLYEGRGGGGTMRVVDVLVATNRPLVVAFLKQLGEDSEPPLDIRPIRLSPEPGTLDFGGASVALVDMGTDVDAGVALCKELRRRRPDLPIVAIVCCPNPTMPWHVRSLRAVGVCNLLDAQVTPMEIVDVVHALARGDAGMRVQFHDVYRALWESDDLVSENSRVILKLVARGFGDADIATQLHVSPRTVQSRVEELRERLVARNRAELAAWAGAHGLYASRNQEGSDPPAGTHKDSA